MSEFLAYSYKLSTAAQKEAKHKQMLSSYICIQHKLAFPLPHHNP